MWGKEKKGRNYRSAQTSGFWAPTNTLRRKNLDKVALTPDSLKSIVVVYTVEATKPLVALVGRVKKTTRRVNKNDLQ